MLPLFLLLLYLALTALFVAYHEPWRDEGQAWLMARDTPTLGAMAAQLGYEGSPGLWHLMLRPMARAGFPYASMHVFNLAICAAAAWLLLFRSPFRAWESALILLGFFPLYGHAVVARSYASSMLLLFLIAGLHPTRTARPVRYGLVLALLANTNVHSAVLAAALGGLLIADLVRTREGDARHALGLAIIAVGIAMAVAQVWPPPDLSPHLAGWRIPHGWGGADQAWQALRSAWANAFCPLAGGSYTPRLIPEGAARWLGLAAGCGTLALVSRSRRALAGYALSTAGLLGIFVAKYGGAPWHCGLLVHAFVAYLWMARLEAPEHAGKPGRWRSVAFASVLVCSVVAGPLAGVRDLWGTYSAGTAVAEDLADAGALAHEALVVASPSWLGASVLPHLPAETRFHYLEYGAAGGFTTWDRTFAAFSGAQPEPHGIARLAAEASAGREAFLVLGGPYLPGPGEMPPEWEIVASHRAAIGPDEGMEVYRLPGAEDASR